MEIDVVLLFVYEICDGSYNAVPNSVILDPKSVFTSREYSVTIILVLKQS
jgi:hypothetical protein